MECTIPSAAPPRNQELPAEDPPGLNPPVVLVVDDSSFLRKRLRQALQPAGYTLVEAENGEAALAALARQDFDCVLTDLVMPCLDGFGLLSAMRERHLTVPVIVLTADIQTSTRERCEGLGAQAILHKPLNPETLRAAVAARVGGKH